MAGIADITTVANATGSGHGFRLVERTTSTGRKVAEFIKDKKGESGTTGAYQATWGFGEDASNATTARTNALASLNAARRHRYAGAPGAASGSTIGTWPDGAATVPVADTN